MYLDKQKAIKGKWRIPERTLFLWAIFGGALGGVLGMRRFKHKTNKFIFKYGFLFLLCLQIALLIFLIFFGNFVVG